MQQALALPVASSSNRAPTLEKDAVTVLYAGDHVLRYHLKLTENLFRYPAPRRRPVSSDAIGGQYYAQKLSAERLQRVYALASERVKQYLQAEIEYVRERIRPHSRVLELGCGYGRVLSCLAPRAGMCLGIDTAIGSLCLCAESFVASEKVASEKVASGKVATAAMNAAGLGLKDGTFDVVACVQNGISAFGVDQATLIREAVRVARPGGKVLFSSYSEKFWPYRLDWFRQQSAAGLLGEIDEQATADGVIVCKDGFRAVTIGPEQFSILIERCGLTATITEVDHSSIFCEITTPVVA